MSARSISLLEPIPWQPKLGGEFPGQESFITLQGKGERMIFCWCPPTPPDQPFLMGSPPDEQERSDDEAQRSAAIPHGFWLAKHPVSQAQWQAVMGNNPAHFKSDDPNHPVDNVSWKDAQAFCQKAGLRLPSETEWEYACRAGTSTPVGIGSGQSLNAQMANFDGNYPYGIGREAFQWQDRQRTVAPASFPPNAWGLQDMHGQLWEWCEDLYDNGSRYRVLRGGGWFFTGWYARSACRYGNVPGYHASHVGFRPCPSSIQKKKGAERGKE